MHKLIKKRNVKKVVKPVRKAHIFYFAPVEVGPSVRMRELMQTLQNL